MPILVVDQEGNMHLLRNMRLKSWVQLKSRVYGITVIAQRNSLPMQQRYSIHEEHSERIGILSRVGTE